MPRFRLVLLIHAHQPVGNFEHVFEQSYRCCYLPFLETLERHPRVRLALHFSGALLEWIERAHPEYFDRLRELCRKRQVEMLGGGFYEPILISIPPHDRLEQLKCLADYVEKHFGERPRGAWLTERVWEPQLPSSLAAGGVEYTLVDDNHFLSAGFQPEQLYGHYTAEDLGHTVKLLPGLKPLRYLIPFRDVAESTHFLWEQSRAHPGGIAAMGDDLEKFGSWPGTHAHCYQNGWLENFFAALENCHDWLDVSTPADAIDAHPPLGRADLPTASYQEMMEWALPTAARATYHRLLDEFSTRADVSPFLRGALWRGFFAKYSESNLMHKKMLRVSEKLAALAHHKNRTRPFKQARDQALGLLLSGQCNDAYWHGVFGGLYSPHLRSTVWRALVQAEAVADTLSHESADYAESTALDFDADGRDEIYFTSNKYAALISPHDGGTISALECRSSGAPLINSLARRPEAYHHSVKNSDGPHPLSLDSIDEQRRARETGLDRLLQYDRWPRHSFRLLLFAPGKTHDDYAAIQLDEDPTLAAGCYHATETASQRITLTSAQSSDWFAQKTFSFEPAANGFDLNCNVKLRRNAPGNAALCVGLETVINFLAPSSPDRYFQSHDRQFDQQSDQQFPLRWSGSLPCTELSMVDEWQRVRIGFHAPHAAHFWIAPIETVSESEDGFERIYQGSQIMAVWPVELTSGAGGDAGVGARTNADADPGGEWSSNLSLHVRHISPAAV